jgi:hypothetical protein
MCVCPSLQSPGAAATPATTRHFLPLQTKLKGPIEFTSVGHTAQINPYMLLSVHVQAQLAAATATAFGWQCTKQQRQPNGFLTPAGSRRH